MRPEDTPRYVQGDHNRRVHFGCGVIAAIPLAMIPAGFVFNLFENWILTGLSYIMAIAILATLAARYGDKYWHRLIHFIGNSCR